MSFHGGQTRANQSYLKIFRIRQIFCTQGQTLLAEGTYQSLCWPKQWLVHPHFILVLTWFMFQSFVFPQAPWVSVRKSPLAPSPLCWGPSDPCQPPMSLPAPTDPPSSIPPTTSWFSPMSTSRRSIICAHSTLRAILTGQQQSFDYWWLK